MIPDGSQPVKSGRGQAIPDTLRMVFRIDPERLPAVVRLRHLLKEMLRGHGMRVLSLEPTSGLGIKTSCLDSAELVEQTADVPCPFSAEGAADGE